MLSLSHVELNVEDAERMEDFYTRVLGFVVTDRGAGARDLVFLSRNPEEHHQVVLNPGGHGLENDRRVDHFSFRVESLSDLRAFHARLTAEPNLELAAVSHGTTWSLYFRDPEDNRLELFTDTPWHVNQPCRFAVDLTLSDDSLAAFTEKQIRNLAGFCRAEDWHTAHADLFEGDSRGRNS